MHDIAFLISSNVDPEREGAREDFFEFQAEFAAIDPACRAAGLRLTPVVWDEIADVSRFDAVVVGTTWDYWDRAERYLERLERFAAQRPVMNPPHVIRWNLSKTYLRDLEAAGALGVPTIWADRAGESVIEDAFEAFGCEEIVVKPVVGAGAWRQARIRRGEALPEADDLPPAEAMIQPFLPAVAEEGEYSFLFFGGVFSHALVKRPKAGDYRVQSLYGGREAVHEPSPGELDLARAVLEAAGRATGEDAFLYARVDMARGLDGRLALMELELIEPYYYPKQGPETGARFAAALEAGLA